MKRRSVRWLFGSWLAYWAILALVKLGPAAVALWRATQSSDPNAGAASINAGSAGLSLVITMHGQTTWSGSVSFMALAAWIGVVPLAIWLLWFVSARADAPVRQAA